MCFNRPEANEPVPGANGHCSTCIQFPNVLEQSYSNNLPRWETVWVKDVIQTNT